MLLIWKEGVRSSLELSLSFVSSGRLNMPRGFYVDVEAKVFGIGTRVGCCNRPGFTPCTGCAAPVCDPCAGETRPLAPVLSRGMQAYAHGAL